MSEDPDEIICDRCGEKILFEKLAHIFVQIGTKELDYELCWSCYELFLAFVE